MQQSQLTFIKPGSVSNSLSCWCFLHRCRENRPSAYAQEPSTGGLFNLCSSPHIQKGRTNMI